MTFKWAGYRMHPTGSRVKVSWKDTTHPKEIPSRFGPILCLFLSVFLHQKFLSFLATVWVLEDSLWRQWATRETRLGSDTGQGTAVGQWGARSGVYKTKTLLAGGWDVGTRGIYMTDEKLVWNNTLQRLEHWGVQNKQKVAACRFMWKWHIENLLVHER